MARSCLSLQIRADEFYEDTETLMGFLMALVDENGQTVNSIRGVILEPRSTDIQIRDVDGKKRCLMHACKVSAGTEMLYNGTSE